MNIENIVANADEIYDLVLDFEADVEDDLPALPDYLAEAIAELSESARSVASCIRIHARHTAREE
jgi:hypothetical protein